MGAAARQECPEGQGRALDEEERCELLRLQEPPRRGQGAQADPQMGCDGRGRARQSGAYTTYSSIRSVIKIRGEFGTSLPPTFITYTRLTYGITRRSACSTTTSCCISRRMAVTSSIRNLQRT